MPNKAPISSVNDFVVRFANVNGSGSASANELFARSVLRMGVPVAPRNIFPSNIQGLPTWYEVRVSEAGHLGARGGVDLMVAMNPQTWDKDVASIEPGGYLFYDSTKPLPESKFRDDINVIGVPLTAICNREYTDPRQRQLFKNIIYVGALSALLDMDVAAIERSQHRSGSDPAAPAAGARSSAVVAQHVALPDAEATLLDHDDAAASKDRAARSTASRTSVKPRFASAARSVSARASARLQPPDAPSTGACTPRRVAVGITLTRCPIVSRMRCARSRMSRRDDGSRPSTSIGAPKVTKARDR